MVRETPMASFDGHCGGAVWAASGDAAQTSKVPIRTAKARIRMSPDELPNQAHGSRSCSETSRLGSGCRHRKGLAGTCRTTKRFGRRALNLPEKTSARAHIYR